ALSQDQPEPSHVQESASDSSSLDLKRFDNTLPLTERQLIKYLRKVSRVLFNKIAKKQWEHHKEAALSYADIKASIEQYYAENLAHRDQTDKLVEASMSSLDRSSTTISDLYKGLDVITQLLKDINNAVKDDPAANQKINKATETFVTISSNITDVLSLVKGFDFFALLSTVKDLQAHALKQEEASTAWTKSSTNMAWNLGSRMTAIEISQTSLKPPSGSVTPTLALTHILANVEGENATNTASEEPPSHIEGETGDTTMAIPISSIQPTHTQPIILIIFHPKSSQATLRIDKGKGIATEYEEDPSKRPVPASTIIRPDPDELVRVEFMINGKIVYLTKKEIQEYWDKEEKMKKAVEEAKLLAMSRPEVIKVVRKEAKKLRIDLKEAISIKAGETFKKA
ncbi:hypothetical protein Tco_0947243, partial [Tanacetum coccineum]